MKNLSLVLAVLILVSACAARKQAPKTADATGTDDKSKTTQTTEKKEKIETKVDSPCEDLDLSGGWKNASLSVKIKRGKLEYQEVITQVDGKKLKNKMTLDEDSCVLTKISLESDASAAKKQFFKLEPKLDDEGSPLSLKLSPCSDEKCESPILSQQIVLERDYGEVPTTPEVDNKTERKDLTQGEAKRQNACSDINWTGQWTQLGVGIGAMCGGDRSNTMDLEPKSVASHLYTEKQTQHEPGLMLDNTVITWDFKFDPTSCIVTETPLKKSHTKGSSTTEMALPAVAYSKVVEYSQAEGKRRVKFVPCSDAACATADASKAFEFESPIPND